MSTSTWSLYDTATGLFRAGVLTASPAQLAANTPPGWAALAGRFDHLSQKVDIAAGGASPVVIDYVPAAPADDALQTWAWDDRTKRWIATPTLAANKIARKAPVQAAIEALEANDSHQRSLREILLAAVASQAPPNESVTALSAIEADIADLRATLAAIDAAATQDELDAIPLSSNRPSP